MDNMWRSELTERDKLLQDRITEGITEAMREMLNQHELTILAHVEQQISALAEQLGGAAQHSSKQVAPAVTDAGAMPSDSPEPTCEQTAEGTLRAARAAHAGRFITKFQSQEVYGMSGTLAEGSRMGTIERELAQRIADSTPKDSARWLIMPHSNKRFVWDMVATMLTFFIAISLPFRIAFVGDSSLGWSIVDFAIDIFFMIDIPLTFRSAYIDSNNSKLVTDPWQIARHYARTWLVLDIVASFPWDWVTPPYGVLHFREPIDTSTGSGAGTTQLSSMLRLFKLLKLLRLLRVARLLQLLGRIEERMMVAAASQSTLRLFNLLILLLFFSHWQGCFQFLIASFDTTVDGNGTSMIVHPDAWIVRAEIVDAPPFHQWSWSFYHAMTQVRP